MKTSEYQHIIFVRPPGSYTWTIHINTLGTPWRRGNAKEANKEAQNIVEHTPYCAIVIAVKLPREPESEQYALFADGDTEYRPTEPFLKKTK